MYGPDKLCLFGGIAKDLSGGFCEHHIEPRRGRGMGKHFATLRVLFGATNYHVGHFDRDSRRLNLQVDRKDTY